MRTLLPQNAQRQEIQLDEAQLCKDEITDPIILPYGILYIPSSNILLTNNSRCAAEVSGIVAAVQIKSS